jgi:hypothetical protein
MNVRKRAIWAGLVAVAAAAAAAPVPIKIYISDLRATGYGGRVTCPPKDLQCLAAAKQNIGKVPPAIFTEFKRNFPDTVQFVDATGLGVYEIGVVILEFNQDFPYGSHPVCVVSGFLPSKKDIDHLEISVRRLDPPFPPPIGQEPDNEAIRDGGTISCLNGFSSMVLKDLNDLKPRRP